MTLTRNIPWARILAEGTIIIVSILLAFWIDAWWQERIERKESEALIRGLLSDFTASQLHLQEWVAGNKRVLRAADEFLLEIRKTPVGEEMAVRPEWLVAAVAAPTFDPTDTSLRTAIATGQIELITDQELRDVLAVWRQQLEDTQEDELLIRGIVVNQLVPILSRQVRLGQALEFDQMISWFTGGEPVDSSGNSRIQVTGEIEGALAERVFYTNFVVEGLSAIYETQGLVLEHLEREIGAN
jgi:hypothetical protein